ncbi:cytoskeleton-associated 5 isoform X2 [Brachionus plicatilis]|uniref:Cytoskeleton-associated 5 isoform X2 n=1 Tax=Brachionus plicatilis TaxID=10195 RepID=A0A3M7PS47_BRAPC|nr:cytoskeleton-associated 5 isoform X2 [Brachionus plicatilis]
MSYNFKGRDSKDMLKLLDKKFVDKIQKKLEKEDEQSEYQRKSVLYESFKQIQETNSPAHLKKRYSQTHWVKNRESLINVALLNTESDYEKVDPAKALQSTLDNLSLYEKRRYEEENGLVSAWNWRTPTKQHINELRDQFVESKFAIHIIDDLFHPHFKFNIRGLEKMRNFVKNDLSSSLQTSDLIFKYFTLKFYERNPLTLYKCIEFLDTYFNSSLLPKFNFKKFELACFLPYFVNLLDDPRYLVRKGIRHNLNQLIELSDHVDIFESLIDQCHANSFESNRIEVLEALGYLIDKFPPTNFDINSFRIIFDLINSSSPSVSNTALNLICLLNSKYGLDSFEEFLNSIDQNATAKINEHIELFENNSQIFPLKNSMFLIDSYTIMQAIKSITGLMKSEIESDSKSGQIYTQDFQEIVFDILDKNKDLSIVALDEILAMMKSKEKKVKIVENVDHVVLSCSVKLLDTISEFISTEKPDRHLFQLINSLQKVVRSIFESGMGKVLATGSLKFCLYSLFKIQLDTNLKHESTLAVLESLTDAILHDSERTKCLCALIRLMTESFVKNFGKNFVEKIVSCIWSKYTYKDKNSNQIAFSLGDVDFVEVMYEINIFLEAVPFDTWESQENDLPLRVINTLIHQIALRKGNEIFAILDLLNIPNNAEIHDFVLSIMDWMIETKKKILNEEEESRIEGEQD